MPLLDGLSATKQIRKEQRDIPIVAMTAHAMQSERQRCLDAGMSDHIAKPFDPEALRAALSRWMPTRDRERRVAVDEISNGFFSPVIGVIDELRSRIRLPDDARKCRVVLAALERDLTLHLSSLREACRIGETDLAAIAAHAIKGMSALTASPKVGEMARALDLAVKSGTDWSHLAEALAREIDELLSIVAVALVVDDDNDQCTGRSN
jgi:HPt (histidine-containing phosphotransfer) domain-containing protein